MVYHVAWQASINEVFSAIEERKGSRGLKMMLSPLLYYFKLFSPLTAHEPYSSKRKTYD